MPLLVPTPLVMMLFLKWGSFAGPDQWITLILLVFAVVTVSHHGLVGRVLHLR